MIVPTTTNHVKLNVTFNTKPKKAPIAEKIIKQAKPRTIKPIANAISDLLAFR